METDITTYKTMFEENNTTLVTMSEDIDMQISKFSDRLDEFDVKGKHNKRFV